jgi:predicted glycosyltransferase
MTMSELELQMCRDQLEYLKELNSHRVRVIRDLIDEPNTTELTAKADGCFTRAKEHPEETEFLRGKLLGMQETLFMLCIFKESKYCGLLAKRLKYGLRWETP